jgi:signal peptidase II
MGRHLVCLKDNHGWDGCTIWEQLGYGLILAGAVGNGIDRLFFGGSVVDFIDLRIINFAIFNWADISINIGIACLLIHNFIDRTPKSSPH